MIVKQDILGDSLPWQRACIITIKKKAPLGCNLRLLLKTFPIVILRVGYKWQTGLATPGAHTVSVNEVRETMQQ